LNKYSKPKASLKDLALRCVFFFAIFYTIIYLSAKLEKINEKLVIFSSFFLNFAIESKKRLMKILFKKFDKREITGLPKVLFQGRIITIITPGETEKAVDYLLSQKILGFDTETRPSFKKGQRYEVSLLQVSTHDTCFLFRLNLTGITPAIIRLLEDKKVVKGGLSWHDDLLQLHRRAEFKAGNFVELQDVAEKFGIEDKSLQKLYANLFHMKISKAQRLSNWEQTILRDAQKLYAATDAWTCIKIYEELQRLSRDGDYELVEPVKLVEAESEVVKSKEAKNEEVPQFSPII